jgi:hypothetical protein
MNRWQRRITAARRIQLQHWYGRTVDLISEPDQLKQLVALSDLETRLPPGHQAIVAGAVRLGLAEDEEDWRDYKQFAGEWVPAVQQ